MVILACIIFQVLNSKPRSKKILHLSQRSLQGGGGNIRWERWGSLFVKIGGENQEKKTKPPPTPKFGPL